MLAFGVVVIAIAYVLASFGKDQSVPPNVIPLFGGVLALFVLTHVVIRKVAPHADPVLLPLAVMLNGIGYVLIARLNPKLAAQQAGWTLLGVCAFVATLVVVRRVRILERNRYTIGLIGVVLLILPMIPGLGATINGARIWVRLGPASFQPGEFSKLALAVFFAAYLAERRERLAGGRKLAPGVRGVDTAALAPLLVAWGASMVVLIGQKDLGSALQFFVLFISMLWLATGRTGFLLTGVGMFGASALLAWTQFTHVKTRVSMWLNPWSDIQGKGYQIVQSTYAMSWGGSTGTGLGMGISGRIPYQETDFIFAIIGEEMGLVGTTLVLAAFLAIAGSGFRVAARASDPFAKVLAVGLTTLFAVQAFVIMAGVTRLLPLTGITLPFVSYGGSSLLSNWVLLALLVRLSDEAEAPEKVAAAGTRFGAVGVS
jgi:peptidoglycan glycosyltransferase